MTKSATRSIIRHLIRHLGRSFTLLRVGGVDVRIHWTVALYLLLALHLTSQLVERGVLPLAEPARRDRDGMLVARGPSASSPALRRPEGDALSATDAAPGRTGRRPTDAASSPVAADVGGRSIETRGTWNEGATMLTALTAVGLIYLIVALQRLVQSDLHQRTGRRVTTVLLAPVGGGCLGGRERGPREEFTVAFWGAAAPLPLFVGALFLYVITDAGLIEAGPVLRHFCALLFWVSAAAFLVNLMPAFPHDGGRLLRSYLAARVSARRATAITAVSGATFALALAAIALLALDTLQLPVLLLAGAQLLAGPHEHARGLRGSVYDGRPSPRRIGTPGFSRRGASYTLLGDYFEERALERRVAEQRREAEVRARVDEILERVSEVGLEGLDEQEREFLRRAADLYRRRTSDKSSAQGGLGATTGLGGAEPELG